MLDIGQDGTGFEANARFARDAATLMLQYYNDDYAPVAGSGNFNLFSADAVGLYNGNIAALSTATYSVTPLLKLFRYDKLNRIKQMQTASISAGEWGSPTDNFSTEYRYDYNGNILSLQRKDATAQVMHHINYTYNAKNNRLQAITATGINSSNYSYDAIGNLANDSGENIQVSWNAMNKVKQVNLPNNRQLQFSYSPTGQRQIKKTGDKTEYYLHDATGNIMCIYELSGNYLTVKERTIYGSKRIGVYRQRIRFGYSGIVGGVVIAPGSDLINILNPQPIISPDGRHYLEGSNRLQVIGVNRAIAQTSTISYTYKKGTAELKGLSPLMAVRPTFLDGAKTAGLRDYELTDHLSNVMAVISDRKLSVDTNSDTITDYYAPQVVSFTDYYPFGFPMAERSGNLSGYRFGFNGQEKDNEVYGEGKSYTAEFWQYDSRLGRRWNVDPVTKPNESPYATFANNPIWFTDKVGLDTIPYDQLKDKWSIFDPEKDVILFPEVVVKPQETSTTTPDQNTQTEKNEQLPTIEQVIPNSAWKTQAPNWTACFTTCQTILRNNGVNNPAPRNLAIQMTRENAARNGLNVSITAPRGLSAINQSLESGVPIIVGVNYIFGNNYNEGTTDHFIIIVGRNYDEQNRLYYRFFDVGTQRANMGTSPMNRLYLQENNILTGITQYSQKRYTVSQVRPNGP